MREKSLGKIDQNLAIGGTRRQSSGNPKKAKKNKSLKNLSKFEGYES